MRQAVGATKCSVCGQREVEGVIGDNVIRIQIPSAELQLHRAETTKYGNSEKAAMEELVLDITGQRHHQGLFTTCIIYDLMSMY